MSSDAVVRFVVGMAVGIAVGFFAANAFDRRPAASAPAATPAAPAATDAKPGAAPANDREDLTDEELTKIRATVDAQPSNYEAQYKLAEFLLRIRKRPSDAKPYYQRAIELEPKRPEPLVGLGDASFAEALERGSEGDYDTKLLDAAAASYEQAIALEPSNAGVHATLGLARSLRRPPDFARAIKEFRTALAADAANEIALQGLATALAETGDVAGAEAALAKLAAADPDSPSLDAAREAVAKAKSKGKPLAR